MMSHKPVGPGGARGAAGQCIQETTTVIKTEEKEAVIPQRVKLGLRTALVALLMVAFAPTAMAQTDGAEQEEERARLPDRADDDPLYWSDMRQIYTMQQRAFHKEGRFAATVYGGLIPNNIFEQYFPIGVRANYYLMENIGLELSSSYALRRATHLREIIRDESGIGASNVPLIGDSQVSHTTFGIKWSPVYGKFSFYDTGLYYFDIYAFGGAGAVVVQSQTEYGTDPSTTVKPEGVLGLGMAIYMGRHAGLRVDYRQFIFAKHADVGGVANPSEVSLGFSWFF